MSDETVGIVVGVDGSDPSKLAVQWAAQEAHVRKLPILLAAAYVVPPIPLCRRHGAVNRSV